MNPSDWSIYEITIYVSGQFVIALNYDMGYEDAAQALIEPSSRPKLTTPKNTFDQILSQNILPKDWPLLGEGLRNPRRNVISQSPPHRRRFRDICRCAEYGGCALLFFLCYFLCLFPLSFPLSLVVNLNRLIDLQEYNLCW